MNQPLPLGRKILDKRPETRRHCIGRPLNTKWTDNIARVAGNPWEGRPMSHCGRLWPDDDDDNRA